MAHFDLVFEGGGAKGSAFVGALNELASAGHSHRRLLGTSAGAITATLLGAGYSPAEMLDAVNETTTDSNGNVIPRFATFMDAPLRSDFTDNDIRNSTTLALLGRAHIPGILSGLERSILQGMLHLDLYCEIFGFVECGGFYAGTAFLNWFREKLYAKGIDPAINWREFARQTGSDVSVVTTDTTEQEMVVLNARTAPDAPVAESVRMSMSIPFVWREMVWQKQWGTYRGKDKTDHIFVDGGVLSNFPIRLVEENDSDIDEIMGTGINPQGAGTIGLLLDESVDVSGAAAIETKRPRLRTADRVMRLVDTMMGTADADAMRRYKDMICRIPVGGYGTTEFRMPKEKLEKLVESGRAAMAGYLTVLQSRTMMASVAASANNPAA